jgi:hypothetical protein
VDRPTEQDQQERRCPRLGGPVAFAYCRRGEAGSDPCFKIFDCWWERFDVVALMRAHLPTDAFQRLCQARPAPKITSLLEIIAQARERTGQSAPTDEE